MKQIGDNHGTPSDQATQISSTFQIVLICTGNRFRSALAEGFLRKLSPGLPLDLRSLGTKEAGPAPPLLEAFEVATKHGLDLTRHRARSLVGEQLGRADLVLGFERRHVAAAVVDAGAGRERSFTLPELADLLPSISPPAHLGTAAAAREVVFRAHELRAALDWRSLPELGDPLGGPRRGYEAAAEQIKTLCVSLLRGLFGGTRRDEDLGQPAGEPAARRP